MSIFVSADTEKPRVIAENAYVWVEVDSETEQATVVIRDPKTDRELMFLIYGSRKIEWIHGDDGVQWLEYGEPGESPL